MKEDWKVRRLNESRGFVAKRIRGQLLRRDMLLFGTSFLHTVGNIEQILRPWEVHKEVLR